MIDTAFTSYPVDQYKKHYDISDSFHHIQVYWRDHTTMPRETDKMQTIEIVVSQEGKPTLQVITNINDKLFEDNRIPVNHWLRWKAKAHYAQFLKRI